MLDLAFLMDTAAKQDHLIYELHSYGDSPTPSDLQTHLKSEHFLQSEPNDASSASGAETVKKKWLEGRFGGFDQLQPRASFL